MKIVNTTRPRPIQTFGSVEPGTVFFCQPGGKAVPLMKVRAPHGHPSNAVRLDDGTLLHYEDNTEVVLPDVELTFIR